MKKIFRLRVLLSAFVVGILTMGIGCGVSFFEFQGMTYAGEKVLNADNMVSKEETLILPSNDMKIFYPAYSVKLEEDDSVDVGNALLEYRAPANTDTHVDFSESAYIYSIATGHVSSQRYNFMSAYTTDYGNDLEAFKTLLYDIKDRKLYTYVSPDITVTLKVNPQDYTRFDVLGDDYSTLYEIPPEIRGYGDNIYYNSNSDEYFTYDENGDYVLIYPVYENDYEDGYEYSDYN